MDDADAAGDEFELELSLPLAWQSLPALPADAQLAQQAQAAFELLRRLRPLTLGVAETGEDPSERPLGDGVRLERKLDLVLELLGRLLGAGVTLPAVCRVWLSAAALRWMPVAEAPAGPLQISLYLDPRYPDPLCLYGLARPAAQGGVRLEFAGIDDGLRDELRRLVFVWHRRAVAQRRRNGR